MRAPRRYMMMRVSADTYEQLRVIAKKTDRSILDVVRFLAEQATT